MIHLIGEYYMTADSNSYTVGKRAESRGKRDFRPNVRYYSNLARAVSETAEMALRDRIASGEVETLSAAVEELRNIKTEILAGIGNHKEG